MATNNAVVTVTAEDRTKQVFNQLNRRLDKLKGAFGGVKTQIAGLVGGAGFGMLSKKTIDTAENLGIVSQKLGVSTKMLQMFRFAGQKTGMSIQATDTAIQRFVRRMQEVSEKGGVAKASVEKYGIQLTDSSGRINSATNLLTQFADVMAGMPTAGEKVLTAFKLFDTEGVTMVNILGEGSKGLSQLQKDFEATGGGMDDTFISQASKFNEELLKMSTALETNFSKALSQVMPQLNGLWTSMATGTEGWLTFGKVMNFTIMGFRVFGEQVRFIATQLVKGLGGSFNIVGAFAKKLFEQMKFGFGDTAKAEEELLIATRDFHFEIGEGIKLHNANIEKIREEYEEGKNALVVQNEATEAIKTKEVETRKLHKTESELAKETKVLLKAEKEKTKLLAEEKKAQDALNKSLEQKKDLLRDEAMAIELTAVTYDEKLEKLQEQQSQELDMLSESLVAQAITHDEYNNQRAISDENYARKKRELDIGTASTAIGTISSMASAVKDESLELFRFWQAVAIAEAIMNTYKGAASMLSVPFVGPALAGMVIALGIAYVAKIASMSPPGKLAGGDIQPNSTYLVGERGPEIITTGKYGGNVTPNNKLGKATNVVINISAVDAQGIDELLIQRKGFLVGLINQSLNRQTKQAI